MVLLKSCGTPISKDGTRRPWLKDYMDQKDAGAGSQEVLNWNTGGKDLNRRFCVNF